MLLNKNSIRLFTKAFIVITMAINSMHAQEVYEIDTKYPVHDLSSALRIFKDADQNFTVETILNNNISEYIRGDEEPFYLELGPDYWGRIDILTQDSLSGWTLNFEDTRIGPPAWTKSNGKVDVYGFVDNKQIFHKKTGVEYARSERDTDANWVLNQVRLEEIPINTPVTLIIKAQKNQIGYSPYFNLSARSPEKAYYHQIFEFRNSFNIFMFGVCFITFLYHVLQYLYLREKVFIWFSIWLLFCTLTHAMTIGMIIGAFTKFRFTVWMLIANGIFYSFWFFGRSFIQSKRKFPKLDLVMKGLAIFLFVDVLITALYVVIFNPQTNQTGIGIHYIVLNIYSIASVVVSIFLLTKKDLFAKYFGVGSLIGASFLIIGTLWSIGIIKPIRFFDPFATAMFLQIIIYSFGINYRRQLLNKRSEEERIKAQETYAEMERIKDLDTIKSRFFANISHEFRTPLSLISAPLSTAKPKQDELGEEMVISRKSYDVINRNTNRLKNLIDQLLELSKIDSGKVHLSLTQGGLVQFIKSIVFSFESLADRNNISLNSSFPQENNTAFYDRDKLEKILANLLSNAFKFTPEGGVITVTMDVTDTNFKMEISDSGKGMTNEEVKRVFERFYRAEGTEEKGSGIGLALVKEMVDVQNGKINVSSRKGTGTIFKFSIPMTLDKLPKDISVVTNEPREVDYSPTTYEDIIPETVNEQAQIQSASNTEHIVLVIEDNQDLREFIASELNNSYKVLTAEDGLRGERMAYEHIPDLVITDVMMPKKDGYLVCNALKSNTKTSHIPIIMLTAKADQTNKIEGLMQGADAYLTKPFNSEELLLRINNLIESRAKLWAHFKASDLAIVDDLDVTSLDDKFLQNVAATIKNNLDNENLSVDDLSKAVGFSRAQLHRKLKALTDRSANQLIVEMRLNEAKRMLINKTGSVSEVAYSVGYSNMSYFSKSFKERFGILPSKV